MKKLFLLLTLTFTIAASKAQESTELSKTEAKEEYCMIMATQKLLSTKVNVDVDFGQEWSFWENKRKITDENGKKMVFNSVIDALNYMSSQGWEFVNAYSLTAGQQNVLHYVMKRDLTETDKAKE